MSEYKQYYLDEIKDNKIKDYKYFCENTKQNNKKNNEISKKIFVKRNTKKNNLKNKKKKIGKYGRKRIRKLEVLLNKK
jgi:hypothetical protein